jgi:REP element-mobilizing transposase RayT
MARIVFPGVPYHIINRGNHKHDVFFLDSDKTLYLKLLDERGEKFGVSYLAYCLMDNHLHLSASPKSENSFAKCFAEERSRDRTPRPNWKTPRFKRIRRKIGKAGRAPAHASARR